MELYRSVALACVIIILLIAAGHALAERDARTHSRKLAERATAEHEDRRVIQEEARRIAAERRQVDTRKRNDEVARRCSIKPVMSDKEIDGCRVAYK